MMRSLVLCSGAGAKQFLNGLLSCPLPDSDLLGYGLLLDRAGRIEYDFFIYCYDQQHYLLDCAAEESSHLASRLAQYAMGSDIKITIPKTIRVITSPFPIPDQDASIFQDPRASEMGWRGFSESQELFSDPTYTTRRLTLGLPEGLSDLPRGKALPLEYGLEQLGAVCFQKGCFIGQEVCNRMYRKQTHKYEVYYASSKQKISPTEPVHLKDGKVCGSILSHYGKKAFVRLNRRISSDQELYQNSHQLSLQPQPWRKNLIKTVS